MAAKAAKRGSSNRVVQMTIPGSAGNITIKLGDVFKEDFASIENPAASVKSCQAAIIAILNLLRPPTQT